VQLNRSDRVGHSVASATQGAVEAPQTIPDFKLNSSSKKVLGLSSITITMLDYKASFDVPQELKSQHDPNLLRMQGVRRLSCSCPQLGVISARRLKLLKSIHFICEEYVVHISSLRRPAALAPVMFSRGYQRCNLAIACSFRTGASSKLLMTLWR
jgi:hypothetical protein